MNSTGAVFNEVRAVVARTIRIEDRANSLTPATPLVGMPEFDSMAVLDVMLALEERFGLTIDDDEVTGELFETLGTLSAFIEGKLK
jgi:acyl carrier protein